MSETCPFCHLQNVQDKVEHTLAMHPEVEVWVKGERVSRPRP